MALVPEGRRVFPALSVENNLRMGAWSHRRDSSGNTARCHADSCFIQSFPRLESVSWVATPEQLEASDRLGPAGWMVPASGLESSI